MNTRLLYHIAKLADDHAVFLRNRNKKQTHLAIAFNKNIPISIALNEYHKSSAMQRKYAALVGKPKCVYDHAEIALLNKCKDVSFDTIVVLRLGKNGNMLPSKPCEICQAAIADTNIKRLIYSGKNTLIEESLK